METTTEPTRQLSVPVWPVQGVSPMVSLATAVHAAPGLYSVLLGSGVSRSAGVPTGWEMTQDLIRQIALAEGIDDKVVSDDPDGWWRDQGLPEPRYDTLLSAVAPSDAARQALLRRYFDASPDGSPLTPTPAHRGLARLAAQGRVRVIVTTNFDRLTERALDEVGLSAQVVADDAAVHGMIPLVHSPVTVIKVHGDYASLPLRNTPTELADYPKAWRKLLGQVFDEYGLIVVGWSGDYDTALVRALTRSRDRRYPIFWAARQGRVSGVGQRVVAQRGAFVVDVAGADELFDELVLKLDRLDRRATRGSVVRFRNVLLHPDRTTGNGWAQRPNLVLSVTGQFSPVVSDTMGILDSATRSVLAEALDRSALTKRLRRIATDHEPTPAEPGKPDPYNPAPAANEASTDYPPAPLQGWTVPQETFSTATNVTFRLGGNARAGVSALVTVAGPGIVQGNTATVTVEAGLSIDGTLTLGDAAGLLRDELMLVLVHLFDALDRVMPADAQPTLIGLNVEAPANDIDGAARDNHLAARVDLGDCGNPPRPTTGVIGISLEAPDSLDDRTALEAVLAGLNRMLLDRGYRDAEQVLSQIAATSSAHPDRRGSA